MSYYCPYDVVFRGKCVIYVCKECGAEFGKSNKAYHHWKVLH